jgi:hypothetical protein
LEQPDQVIKGLKKGLKCNANAVVCLGETAFKYKDYVRSFRKKFKRRCLKCLKSFEYEIDLKLKNLK